MFGALVFTVFLLMLPGFFRFLCRVRIIFFGSPKAQIALRIKMKKEMKHIKRYGC